MGESGLVAAATIAATAVAAAVIGDEEFSYQRVSASVTQSPFIMSHSFTSLIGASTHIVDASWGFGGRLDLLSTTLGGVAATSLFRSLPTPPLRSRTASDFRMTTATVNKTDRTTSARSMLRAAAGGPTREGHAARNTHSLPIATFCRASSCLAKTLFGLPLQFE